MSEPIINNYISTDENGVMFCNLCKTKFNNKFHVNKHLITDKHYIAVAKIKNKQWNGETRNTKEDFDKYLINLTSCGGGTCKLCNTFGLKPYDIDKHFRTDKHILAADKDKMNFDEINFAFMKIEPKEIIVKSEPSELEKLRKTPKKTCYIINDNDKTDAVKYLNDVRDNDFEYINSDLTLKELENNYKILIGPTYRNTPSGRIYIIKVSDKNDENICYIAPKWIYNKLTTAGKIQKDNLLSVLNDNNLPNIKTLAETPENIEKAIIYLNILNSTTHILKTSELTHNKTYKLLRNAYMLSSPFGKIWICETECDSVKYFINVSRDFVIQSNDKFRKCKTGKSVSVIFENADKFIFN